MGNRIGRRRVRKRKNNGDAISMRIGIIVIILIAVIFLGYLTARFVIGSIIGYNADESPIKLMEKTEQKADKDSEKTASGENIDAQKKSGYALQFGAFSTRDAAEDLSEKLKEKNISTNIIKVDDIYKVISPVTDEKSEAAAELDKLSGKVEDVFIAAFNN